MNRQRKEARTAPYHHNDHPIPKAADARVRLARVAWYSIKGEHMVAKTHHPRTPAFNKRKALQLAVAGALAAGMLAAPQAYSRITKIDITSRTTAFGNY